MHVVVDEVCRAVSGKQTTKVMHTLSVGLIQYEQRYVPLEKSSSDYLFLKSSFRNIA